MTQYCWFNPVTGKFSDSWAIGEQVGTAADGVFYVSQATHNWAVKDHAENPGDYRLIEYKVSGKPLSFSRFMKLK